MISSSPDVQNVPDVWGLLERARDAILQRNDLRTVVSDIRDALAARDRFVLVPKAAPASMLTPYLTIEQWRLILAAAPKPEGKPKVKCEECGRMVTAGDPHDCEDK